MNIPPFAISTVPHIVFGDGVRRRLPELAQEFGQHVLLVTGQSSFPDSPAWPVLLQGLEARNMTWVHVVVRGEPSPQLADDMARRFRDGGINVVIGIGGGSVLDAAKAIAGLLRVENGVMDLSRRRRSRTALPGACCPVYRRADHRWHGFRGDQECGAFYTRRVGLQEVLPP